MPDATNQGPRLPEDETNQGPRLPEEARRPEESQPVKMESRACFGLENVSGVDCFMNAAIQCVLACPPILDHLLSRVQLGQEPTETEAAVWRSLAILADSKSAEGAHSALESMRDRYR